MANKKLFVERRGRKKSTDKMEQVVLYINNSVICDDNGKTLDNQSEEYRKKLDDFKRKLTLHIYEKMVARDSPLALTPQL